MLNFGMIAAGFASVMTLQGLFYIALGTFVGIIFGAVPGLSGSVAIALFIPVTYTLEPNISIALIMGRYFPIVGQVAIAGLLASKKCIPESAGTLRTDTGTFSLMTFAVIIIVAALSFFPALALGPIADYLTF